MAMLPFSSLPHSDESGMSWLLRLTDGNLLRSPWPLLRMLGMDRPRVSHLRVDLGRVAELCGLPSDAIEPFRCSALPGGRMVSFRGHAIQRHALRNGRAVVCPHCILDLGYARAIWDVRLVTACPVHKVKLVSHCSNCGSALSWLRPRLDLCRCGHAISEMTPVPLDPAELAVSAALECALSKSTEPWTRSLGTPNALLEEVSTMSLAEALEVFKWLARVADGVATRSMRDDADQIARSAGPALCNWPAAYHAALDSHVDRRSTLGKNGASNAPANSAVDVVLLLRLMLRRFAVQYGHGESVLESEIIRYIKLRFADTLLDTRVARVMRSLGVEPRWISLQEASRRLRIDHRTAYRLVEDGRLESRSVERAGGARYFVRTDQLRMELSAMRIVRLTNVSKLLGLPLSVLLDLRQSGTISRTSELGRTPGISQADIDAFRARWAAVKTSAKPRAIDVTTLFTAFRSKTLYFNIAWKADAIRRMLDGSLQVFSVQTTPVLDATVSVADLRQIMDDHRQRRLTLGGAGHALRLSKIGVLRLVVDGHLKAVLTETEIGFERSEVARFASRYVQMHKLSKSAARAGQLIATCEARRIPYLRAGSGSCPGIFVPRESVKQLGKLLGQSFEAVAPPMAMQLGRYARAKKVGRPRASSGSPRQVASRATTR